ncbi:MAG TPA: hypothetical protein VGR50_01160 [Terriglobales bacterium]|nr:hypothetical protein [Terriglobales bacterium]
MYKVVRNGVEIHCDTADEAVEIAAKLGAGEAIGTKQAVSHAGPIAGSRWTVARFNNLMHVLQDKQREFLREVVKNPDGITDAQLRDILKLKSNKAFGPVLTALSRKAKKVGVSMGDMFVSKKEALDDGQKFIEFRPTASFRQVAHDAGGVK